MSDIGAERRILISAIEQQREHRRQLSERGEPDADCIRELARLIDRLNRLDRKGTP